MSTWAFRITSVLLIVGILGLGSFLLLVAVPDIAGQTSLIPTPTPEPTPPPKSGMALSPVGIEMPPDANCEACHVTTTGVVGTRQIPPMAHPLTGWRDCTACHSLGSLVVTAPGHSSLHKDECLICHQTQDAAGTATKAPMRPEHMGEGGALCTDCHGVDEHAPMPESMKDRGSNCWICHNGEEFRYLFESSAPAGEDEGEGEGDELPSPAPSAGTGSTGGPLYALQASALP